MVEELVLIPKTKYENMLEKLGKKEFQKKLINDLCPNQTPAKDCQIGGQKEVTEPETNKEVTHPETNREIIHLESDKKIHHAKSPMLYVKKPPIKMDSLINTKKQPKPAKWIDYRI
jgi:hypothetical protein